MTFCSRVLQGTKAKLTSFLNLMPSTLYRCVAFLTFDLFSGREVEDYLYNFTLCLEGLSKRSDSSLYSASVYLLEETTNRHIVL